MRVETRDGGDGVRCWNVEAIARYAEETDRREAQLGRDNPDLVVTEGRLSCYGCELLDYDLGVRCTAVLTTTLYGVRGEITPRAEDAAGFLSDIPGMVSRIDAPPEHVQTSPPVQTSAAAPTRPRGLFRRGS